MCLQDLRLGRVTPTAVYRILNGVSRTFPASRQRVGIAIIPDAVVATPTLTDIWGGDSLVVVDGVTIVVNAFAPAHWTLMTHGDLCQRTMIVTAGAVMASNCNVMEWFLPESAITEAIENFKRQYPLPNYPD